MSDKFSFPDISLVTGIEIYGPHTFVVNVNGTIIGITRTPVQFIAQFRKLRRARRISEFVSVYVNHHHCAVYIASDGGRICRPIIIVENGKPRVTSEHIVVCPRLPLDRLKSQRATRNSRKAVQHLTTSYAMVLSSIWTSMKKMTR